MLETHLGRQFGLGALTGTTEQGPEETTEAGKQAAHGLNLPSPSISVPAARCRRMVSPSVESLGEPGLVSTFNKEVPQPGAAP